VEKTLCRSTDLPLPQSLSRNFLIRCADRHLGPVVPAAVSTSIDVQTVIQSRAAKDAILSLCLNLNDFELAAEKILSRRAWAYFHSAADDLRSMRSNLEDWSKITLRPRVLQNVSRADMSRSIMGFQSSLPFGIAPAAMAKLGHSDGELCLARGAARKNIAYCISTASSTSLEDLEECWRMEGKGGCLFFQLYVNKVHQETLNLIATARRLDFKVLVITVDSPVIGKREEDERFKIQADLDNGLQVNWSDGTIHEDEKPVLRGHHSYTFAWDDLKWVKKAWNGPLVLKGIQTAEDAKLACELGVDGIYLSNHGGRQCDDAPSAIRTLLEIRRFCPEILDKIEVWLDGGVRRGTDVFKALCLGATAVFLGRPFMYALGVHGTDGVSHAIRGTLTSQ
jgi:L-lactate dehydrogenase (cytochrome)